MADVKIHSCNCKNDYQDKTYGNGQRVYNPNVKGGFRCTVCKASIGGGEKKK